MERKIPKYEKMYKNSPKIDTDESGKKYIKKGPSEAEEKSARTSDGTEGVKMDEHGPMYERHMKETSDMHDRHLDERKDMVKRHMKEMKKATPDGEEMIEKVEGNKKEKSGEKE